MRAGHVHRSSAARANLGRASHRRHRWWFIATLGALAIVGGVAHFVWPLPGIRLQRLHQNESEAITLLKYIWSAQEEARASGILDPDGNGTGGFGFLTELRGLIARRMLGRRRDYGQELATFGGVGDFAGNGGGAVENSGYVFQMWLPAVEGSWVAEHVGGGRQAGTVDEDLAEREWLCYAWPATYGVTGRRAFVITQGGDILRAQNFRARYSGAHAPDPDRAGFVEGDGGDGTIQANGKRIAVNANGLDGEEWWVVG